MTIMIFNIFNNGLSCPSLIADLCWFVEYFSGLPSTPIGLQWTIATIVKRVWISKISRHRYHRYHCPSRGHRGPPPIRRFAFTSTTCFCPVSGSISEKRRHALSFAARKTRAFCDICDICVFCLVLFMLSGSIQLFIVCWWLVQTHSKNSGQWGWGEGSNFFVQIIRRCPSLLTSLSCKPPSCIKKDTQKRLGLTDLIASLWHPQDLLGLNVLYNVVFGWSFALAEQPTQQIRRISKNYGS